MDELTQEMNSLLFEIDKKRWISLSKNDSNIRFKAKDKLRALELIERHGKLSWQLTKEGYKAVELGGFQNWQKSYNKQNNIPNPLIVSLIKFWWLVIIPLVIGILIILIEHKLFPS